MNTIHPLASAYLDRLRSAASVLPPERASELVSDIAEHLDAALPPNADAAMADGVLQALGTPAEVVAAASEDLPRGESVVEASEVDRQLTPGVQFEVVGLVCLVTAVLLFFLPPVSLVLWLAGVLVLGASRRWTRRDKLIGLSLVIAPVVWLVFGLTSWGGTVPIINVPVSGLVLTVFTLLAVYALARLFRRIV